MLIFNLPETSKITIVAVGFTGNKSSYKTNIMHFLDMLEYKYAFVAGEIHLIDKINDDKKKKNLAEHFDIYKTQRGLPSWVGIKVE